MIDGFKALSFEAKVDACRVWLRRRLHVYMREPVQHSEDLARSIWPEGAPGFVRDLARLAEGAEGVLEDTRAKLLAMLASVSSERQLAEALSVDMRTGRRLETVSADPWAFPDTTYAYLVAYEYDHQNMRST
jgi:hypothetical protein